ncbi:hypothetical protein G6F24_014958 [Rhizopus arrhizus]|nr:hypothetical protein G6F24_014958 [Rhizopus arrhizus]
MAHRRANWRQSHSEVIQALHALRRAGTEIIYIPGNHDASLRQVCGLMLPAMQVRRRAIHVTADGRRLLVAHGDDYDGVTHFGGLQEKFGDWLYYRILTGNQALTFNGVIGGTGSLVKNGATTLTLNNANTFSGGLSLAAGGLVLGNAGALGTGALNVGAMR